MAGKKYTPSSLPPLGQTGATPFPDIKGSLKSPLANPWKAGQKKGGANRVLSESKAEFDKRQKKLGVEPV